ncbi:MAG: PH domain-containing protein [Ruminococcus flavefaciens]|nr:PH domain-containing protein [Ruminococcus flavefaciens]MCM1229225.1 PH domain-containing protein [Ruminococcus flavefaciens]
MYNEHPLRIMRYSMKNIWLLIFPLLRGATVLKFDPAGIYAWIQGAWKDVAVLGIILLFGFIRWYFSRISITESAVIHTDGLFIKVTKTIPVENISAVTSERLFLLAPFRAMTIRCDTRAGVFKSTDMKLLVTAKVGREIMSHIPKPKRTEITDDFPEPTVLSVLLFSAFFSSGFSGAVYIAVFFFKGGDIAHDLLTVWFGRITEMTEKITEKFILNIPRTGIVIGVFFLVAWLLSFIVNVLRYSRFRVSADCRYINISCGITNRKEYRIRTEHINYTDLRQNLIMKLCGAVSVNISCAGYGSDSKQLPVLLPMRKENNLGSGLERIGISSDEKIDFRPKISGIFSYIWQPLTAVVAVFVAYQLADRYIPQLSELLYFLVVMGEIPLVWLVAVKTASLFRSGITVDGDKIIVRSTKMTAFHTVIAEKKKVVNVEIRQSIFQRITRKKCHIRIWFTGESRSCFTVKSVSVTDAEKICNLL